MIFTGDRAARSHYRNSNLKMTNFCLLLGRLSNRCILLFSIPPSWRFFWSINISKVFLSSDTSSSAPFIFSQNLSPSSLIFFKRQRLSTNSSLDVLVTLFWPLNSSFCLQISLPFLALSAALMLRCFSFCGHKTCFIQDFRNFFPLWAFCIVFGPLHLRALRLLPDGMWSSCKPFDVHDELLLRRHRHLPQSDLVPAPLSARKRRRRRSPNHFAHWTPMAASVSSVAGVSENHGFTSPSSSISGSGSSVPPSSQTQHVLIAWNMLLVCDFLKKKKERSFDGQTDRCTVFCQDLIVVHQVIVETGWRWKQQHTCTTHGTAKS